jgi:hypothetical protein
VQKSNERRIIIVTIRERFIYRVTENSAKVHTNEESELSEGVFYLLIETVVIMTMTRGGPDDFGRLSVREQILVLVLGSSIESKQIARPPPQNTKP